MPKKTCLSIPITTGNTPCSSFFPTCSSPNVSRYLRRIHFVHLYHSHCPWEFLQCLYHWCRFYVFRVFDLREAERFCIPCTGKQEGSSVPGPCVYNSSTCVWNLPESTGSWSSLLGLIGAQMQGTRREQATHISLSVFMLILIPGSQTPFLPVPWITKKQDDWCKPSWERKGRWQYLANEGWLHTQPAKNVMSHLEFQYSFAPLSESRARL